MKSNQQLLKVLLSLAALLITSSTCNVAMGFTIDHRNIQASHLSIPNPLTSYPRRPRPVAANCFPLYLSSSSSSGASDKTDLFDMEGWPPIQQDLDRVPIFTVATKEGNPLAYQVQVNSEKSFTVPFFYCNVDDALRELETSKNNTTMEGLDILPFPLGKAFELWCKDEAVIVPSKEAVQQAGAPPGTNPVGQQVPMFTCMDIMEENEADGTVKLPLFMALEDANNAVDAAVQEDGGNSEDFEVVCLSLSAAVEQLATIPDTPGFHFIPPSSSMEYISDYLS